MTILKELQAFLDDPGNAYHFYCVGICTAHRSPGYFASAKTRGGVDTQHTAEGATVEEALRRLMDMMRAPPTPAAMWQMPPALATKPQMPGMTRRMPGM